MLANKVSQTYNPPLSSTHCKERSKHIMTQTIIRSIKLCSPVV